MQVSLSDFGPLIAFVLPGILVLAACATCSTTVRRWFGGAEREAASLGGALLVLVTALGAGILLDAVRLQTVDRIHHVTGIEQPTWTYANLDESKFAQFEGIVENHFRFHQFYGNLFVALLVAYVIRRPSLRQRAWRPGWLEAGGLAILVISWIGSRTELLASYEAISELLEPN